MIFQSYAQRIRRYIKPTNVPPTVTVGGQPVTVEPLTMENALRLALLLGPHIAVLENHWRGFRQALRANGERPRLLQAVFTALQAEMREMPGDMMQAMALLLDRDVSFLIGQMTAQEFVEALGVLDEVNDFMALWGAVKGLGLDVKRSPAQRRDAKSGNGNEQK